MAFFASSHHSVCIQCCAVALFCCAGTRRPESNCIPRRNPYDLGIISLDENLIDVGP